MPENSKLLVVDDHEDTLFALESALDPLNYELVRATDGEQALKEVLRGDVGLMLLDLRMPGVDGMDVVRYTRRLEQTQSIPIILLTGFGLTRDLSHTAFQLGVADVVMKPIDPLTLRTKVRYLYATYNELQALRQEVHDLRARVPAQRTASSRRAPGLDSGV
ncbi:two-component system response regulator [Streptomyces sp. NPDC059002]|uniref:response regulator n=1 Tax=Streptomyces sp. NPDC059002 TaxID=3346690 RepID=UPI00369C2799